MGCNVSGLLILNRCQALGQYLRLVNQTSAWFFLFKYNSAHLACLLNAIGINLNSQVKSFFVHTNVTSGQMVEVV